MKTCKTDGCDRSHYAHGMCNSCYNLERYYYNRNEYFSDKSCVKCGSKENLELDHIDPKTKDPKLVGSSGSLWLWSVARRDTELSKCQVLCKIHHDEKTKTNKDNARFGSNHPKAKLTDNDVREIRKDISSGMSLLDAGNKWNITRQHVGRIVRKDIWSHVDE